MTAFEPPPNAPGELEEARRITRQMCGYVETMKTCDRRFWQSWRCYLMRTGDQARIGPHRLALLRRVLDAYAAKNLTGNFMRKTN